MRWLADNMPPNRLLAKLIRQMSAPLEPQRWERLWEPVLAPLQVAVAVRQSAPGPELWSGPLRLQGPRATHNTDCSGVMT